MILSLSLLIEMVWNIWQTIYISHQSKRILFSIGIQVLRFYLNYSILWRFRTTCMPFSANFKIWTWTSSLYAWFFDSLWPIYWLPGVHVCLYSFLILCYLLCSSIPGNAPQLQLLPHPVEISRMMKESSFCPETVSLASGIRYNIISQVNFLHLGLKFVHYYYTTISKYHNNENLSAIDVLPQNIWLKDRKTYGFRK